MKWASRLCLILLLWGQTAFSADTPSHHAPKESPAKPSVDPTPTPVPGSPEAVAEDLEIQDEDRKRWASLLSEDGRPATTKEFLAKLDELKLPPEEKEQALFLWAADSLRPSEEKKPDPTKAAIVAAVLAMRSGLDSMKKFGAYLSKISERQKGEATGGAWTEASEAFLTAAIEEDVRRTSPRYHASPPNLDVYRPEPIRPETPRKIESVTPPPETIVYFNGGAVSRAETSAEAAVDTYRYLAAPGAEPGRVDTYRYLPAPSASEKPLETRGPAGAVDPGRWGSIFDRVLRERESQAAADAARQRNQAEREQRRLNE
jgi:hypothetical protein